MQLIPCWEQVNRMDLVVVAVDTVWAVELGADRTSTEVVVAVVAVLVAVQVEHQMDLM